MQIRTPKKYQGIQRRSILGCRRMSFYLLMIALIAIGIGIFLNRETLAPVVQETLLQIIEELEGRAATMAAPLPTPTHDPQNTLLEADNYWQGGSLGEAALLYMDIAESMPNTVEVFRRIAIGLINASRYDEAADYAERAINADPYDAQAWAIRAWALDWQARPAEALSSALHALELDPDNSRAGAYLAEIYFNLGQPERGEALLAELLENDPNSPEAYRARGLIKQEYRYDFDGAIEDYKSAYSMANHMNLYATDIAVIEIGLRNFATAEDYVQQVIEVEPFNARALFQPRADQTLRRRQPGASAALSAGLCGL